LACTPFNSGLNLRHYSIFRDATVTATVTRTFGPAHGLLHKDGARRVRADQGEVALPSIVFNDEGGHGHTKTAVAAARLNAGMGLEVLRVELSGRHTRPSQSMRAPHRLLFASRHVHCAHHGRLPRRERNGHRSAAVTFLLPPVIGVRTAGVASPRFGATRRRTAAGARPTEAVPLQYCRERLFSLTNLEHG